MDEAHLYYTSYSTISHQRYVLPREANRVMVELCLLEVNFFGDGMYVNSMGIGPISVSFGYKLSPNPSH